MEPNITAKLADEMLRMALARRNNPKGCVHHSDYSAQYASLLPSETMSKHGVRPSIGSISSPWGNAAMGSLTAIVKSECPHARDVFEYIEVVHNRARIHSTLNCMNPAKLEEANWPEGEDCSEAA